MKYIDNKELFAVAPIGERRTLSHTEAEGCIILTHTADPPSDAEWQGWLEALRRYLQRTHAPRLLVVSQGGAPSPKQRRSADILSAPYYRNMKVAIVSESTFLRGVVAAFRVLLPFYRAYPPSELIAALDYLDVSRDRVRQVERCLMGLLDQGVLGAA
jgi:hypothetical protein